MEWMDSIGAAIDYIEANLQNELTVEKIAKAVHISPFYFQKGFSMLCGFTVGEYVRLRRLALAGSELVSTEAKVIDVALKYGYDSPDSFTKAFVRFHGVTPLSAKKSGAMIKSFAPLKISFQLKGGYTMDYKIVKKDAFTVMGAAKTFPYDEAKTAIPQFWAELFQSGDGKVCGMYGVNIDGHADSKAFEYLIGDPYDGHAPVPAGLVTRTVPALTWAVFPCVGPMPNAMQQVNERIFSEWLPGCRAYELSNGYCVELYDDPHKHAKGVQDERYYCEIWMPVKSK